MSEVFTALWNPTRLIFFKLGKSHFYLRAVGGASPRWDVARQPDKHIVCEEIRVTLTTQQLQTKSPRPSRWTETIMMLQSSQVTWPAHTGLNHLLSLCDLDFTIQVKINKVCVSLKLDKHYSFLLIQLQVDTWLLYFPGAVCRQQPPTTNQ